MRFIIVLYSKKYNRLAFDQSLPVLDKIMMTIHVLSLTFFSGLKMGCHFSAKLILSFNVFTPHRKPSKHCYLKLPQTAMAH
jgi:hypothetical protein